MPTPTNGSSHIATRFGLLVIGTPNGWVPIAGTWKLCEAIVAVTRSKVRLKCSQLMSVGVEAVVRCLRNGFPNITLAEVESVVH